MTLTSEARNRIGRMKGFGGCLRCGGTWDYTESHITDYDETGGCFPLCETCWECLCIEDRLFYYYRLYGQWLSDALDMEHVKDITEKWPKIKAAVKAGK